MPEFQNKRLSRKRIFLFSGISISSPFIILILLEILLRIFHYGNNLDLFIESPGNKDFLVFNPSASKRYFTNQAIATTGNKELFKKEKDTNTCRIFVLGESTTIGYPYFHNGSFHRWLQFRLLNSFPDRQFEVINLSLTAVNSYTVLGFAKEVINYQPDAVLIYTGHNEYYGVLGVGSTDNIGGSPQIIKLMLNLRDLRLIQLMTNLYEKILNNFRHDQNTKGGTRMELMVADQQISYQSTLYKRGIAQFTSNLDEVFKIFSVHKVPVFVGTLVSNEKDMKPFVNIEPDSIILPAFKKKFASGMQAFESGDLKTASRLLAEANRVYSFYALCNFTLGSITYEQGQYDSAKNYFARARDLDGLRFRAPGELNRIIAQLSSKYPNVHQVDTKSVFEAKSEHQIIGNELILEHVHPNLNGYALMSDAFYEEMKKDHFIVPESSREMTFMQLKRDMPVTTVDSLAGIFKIVNLKKSWPFSEVMSTDSFKIESHEEKIAYNLANKKLGWFDAMDNLYNYYIDQGNFSGAKTVVEGLALEYPEDPAYMKKTGMLYGRLNDYAHAVFYFKKSFALSPSLEDAKMLFVIYLKEDKPMEAIPYLNYAVRIQGNSDLIPVKRSAEEVIRLENDYAKDSTNIPILNAIARKYMEMGNIDGALKYIQKALAVDPGNSDALLIERSIKQK